MVGFGPSSRQEWCSVNGIAMRGRRRRPKRRGYVRRSRAKPKTGWSLRELAQLSGVAGRTIRLYLQRGVLPRPRFMGPATRYQSEHLVWLLAIRRLRTVERLPLSAIGSRLRALTPADLKIFATENLPAGKIADVLGIQPAPLAQFTLPAGHALPPREESSALSSLQVPQWGRIELALGLELHVRDDASARVIDLARRLRELCASGWPTDKASSA